MEFDRILKLRVKDKHSRVLDTMAREVNTVWNFCNETSNKAIVDRREFLSGYDLQKLTAGFSMCDDVLVGSGTIQLVCVEYARRRTKYHKAKLKWRVSNQKSSNKSLGWVPFKIGSVSYKAGNIKFCGQKFSIWDSYDLNLYELRSGSFSQDSRGNWYLNVGIKVRESCSLGKQGVGIDLGLKNALTTSDGLVITGRWLRKKHGELASAQRAGKKDRVKAIHAKIANARRDAMHKFSTSMVNEYGAIFVGDVSSNKLVKTKMAKSTLDAGWGMLKTMLEYKSHRAGVVFEIVNERYSTQTCSCCGVIPISSPKGRAGLGIREWACVACGSIHDRDINAAKNILAVGLGRLGVGISE